MSKVEKNQGTNSTELTIQEEIQKLPTKSSQIRYLKGKGYKVSQICKLIKYTDGRDLRPQHVYNVLKTPLVNKG